MMRFITLNIALQLCFWGLVLGLPAPQDAIITTSSIPTSTVAPTGTGFPTTTHIVTATPSDIPLNNVPETSTGTTSPITIIILVLVFVLFPVLGLYFCCRGHLSCMRRKEKRSYYNASYPQQMPGNIYLVPVNQFVPPDSRTGYTVRVDTPANPTDMATPVYPGDIHPPSRAASPPGRENGKNGGWKGLFKP